MTLVEVCEPLFQYVCRVCRSARKGVSPEMSNVRADLKQIFSDMKTKAVSERLTEQYDKVEIVLIGFADSMLKQSKLTWANQWQEMAHERRELAMDEKFFDLLDEHLRDKSDQATERLAVFYTCLGLGFTGWYVGQPEELRKKMREIASRMGNRMDADRSARICQDAYENVDRRNLYQPPSRALTRIAIVLIGLTLTVLAANIGLFIDKREQMGLSVKKIIEKDQEVTESVRKAIEAKGGAK